LEDSSWHKKQLLGTRNAKGSGRLRLPPMKNNFKRKIEKSETSKISKKRPYRLSSPRKSLILRTNRRKKPSYVNLDSTNKKTTNTLAYTISNNDDVVNSNLHTVDFQLEDRSTLLGQKLSDVQNSSVTRSQVVQTNSGVDGIKNSSQTITFGKRSSQKNDKSQRRESEVVQEVENSEVESEEMDITDLQRRKPNVVSSEVIKTAQFTTSPEKTDNRAGESARINFESFDPTKANELDQLPEDESKHVTTENSNKTISRQLSHKSMKMFEPESMEVEEEIKQSKAEMLGYVDKGVLFKKDKMFETQLKEIMDKGHVEDFSITRNMWKSDIIKDNKSYSVVLL